MVQEGLDDLVSFIAVGWPVGMVGHQFIVGLVGVDRVRAVE